MRRVLGRFGLCLFGIVLGLLLAEGIVRVFRLDEPSIRLSLFQSKEPTSTYHERLGWMTLPNRQGALSSGPNARIPLETNRQGFRFSRDFEVRRGPARRVAIVGDSQVFGFFVGEKDHLSAILDRELADFDVYPFGVPGYGPTQEMLLLDEVVFAYRPDFVVVVLFADNDLIDDTHSFAYGGLPKPYLFRTAEGWRLGHVPVPVPISDGQSISRAYLRPRSEAFARSALYRLLIFRGATAPWLAWALDKTSLAPIHTIPEEVPRSFVRIDGSPAVCTGVASNCPEAHWFDGLDATVEAYRRMKLRCAERGVPLLVLLDPAMFEFQRRDYPLSRVIMRALEDAGIEVISLDAAFSRDGAPARFVSWDYHWNTAGTRRVADVLRSWLLER